MKTVVFVIAQEGFQDKELLEPKQLFDNAGFQTIIASNQKGLCKGSLGVELESDISIADIDVSKIDALIVVGGPGSPSLLKEESLGEKLLQVRDEEKLLGAICYGPALVASFDVINHASATVFADEFSMNMFKEHNILFVDELVVVDDNLVTANGPAAASAFGEQIVELLK